MGDNTIVKVENVTKKFGEKIVLDKVDIDIPEGVHYGIIGLSGSGKTTLLNIIIGFWKPTMGRVLFNGLDVQKHKKFIDQNFGFATQSTSVYPTLTVEENLSYFGRLYGMRKDDIKKRTKMLLDLMDLTGTEHVLAKELSTGMIKRLDIACAIIHSPKVLLLDEPTEDLDPVLRKEILALIKKINDAGTTIIMTSHMLNEVEVVCDRVSILHNGKVIEQGTPDELKNRYSKNIAVHLITYPGRYGLLQQRLGRLNISNMVVKSNKIVLYTQDVDNVLHAILTILNRCREKIVELEVHKPSMEEVFEYITRR